MKITTLLSLVLFIAVCSFAQRPQADIIKAKGGDITIQPIMHATMVISYHNKTIYIDPTGGEAAFKDLKPPDLIIITDIHGDHFDAKTIEAINTAKATLIMPKAVADMLPSAIDKQQVVILNNGSKTKQQEISIEAIPMYNLPEEAASRHPKGRGNGYILTMGKKKIYISGDTEDIPEMRSLKNIDVAFVCMNLPYTMDVNQAAQGVLAFRPKIVYPYHYRGQDTNTFKSLVVAGNSKIDVRLRNWYPPAK